MGLSRTACATLLAALLAPAPVAASGHGLEATFDRFHYQGSDPADAAHPLAAGQFRNPVLKGFYPDPSVVRVGGDYYLVASTFGWFPGIPVFHSRDLVNWTQIGNAIDRPDQLDFGRHDLVNGVFAPAIEHHDGRFWIVNTCFPSCGGNFVITAADPAGPWSDPVWLPDLGGGIDPSLFFDDDGRAWIVNNDVPAGPLRYEGHRAVWLQEFDPKAMRTTGPRRVILDGGGVPADRPEYVEGPHLYKKDGWYYLVAAEGGTGEGHRQVALRSRRVTGPYEPWKDNPILTQSDLPRERPFPITSAGHADLVQTQDGDWWAVFLGNRPYPPLDGHYVNTGRETFLLPVHWQDGWPRITAPGETVPYVLDAPKLPAGTAALPTRGGFAIEDEFDAQRLPLYWMTVRTPRERWYRLEGGALHLRARPVRLGERDNPSFLARRQQHQDATATTSLRFSPQRDGDTAGLAAFQNEDHWYLLAVTREAGAPVIALFRRDRREAAPEGERLLAVPLPSAEASVQLRIRARGAKYDFEYALQPGQWRSLSEGLDGTLLSTARAGGFTGAVFGLYAARAPEAAPATGLPASPGIPGSRQAAD
ncbi:glycoside hydrolase 43 family protein [Pseudoxanthomonas broegbernensis]|uniref:Glycoside hydrolase 43 family protein n=1 Tax=Pseudoxanthomonas broegbernensis TaxID=83619 RepID=A0A7V8GM12_9GAMM|nr:glycoside hydrolase family 43 protein [Pseudoxanthomonas broegbernensis]KAF1686181.1 glycoside hydrolase 43 family protein [Pseudoxanthomonas broegbernensis]MBB6063889.1 alpha-N-arabinofuranosidase [Pseudoxanthomonas broegbernensis]